MKASKPGRVGVEGAGEEGAMSGPAQRDVMRVRAEKARRAAGGSA